MESKTAPSISALTLGSRWENTQLVEVPAEILRVAGGLGLSLRYQALADWCWAAVSAAVERFYDPASTVTQASLAREFLPSAEKAQAIANRPWHPVAVLRARGYLDEARDGLLADEELREQLRKGQPVVLIAGAPDSAGQTAPGHVVVVTGMTKDGRVLILDPNPVGGGWSLLPYDKLAHRGYRRRPNLVTLLTRRRFTGFVDVGNAGDGGQIAPPPH